MITKEGSTKIVNFMTPWAGVLLFGCGHINPYRKHVLSSTLSIYSTLIAIGLWCCFPIPWSLIFIYSTMGLLIYKYEPFWQEVNVKSLILRWPLRPVNLSSHWLKSPIAWPFLSLFHFQRQSGDVNFTQWHTIKIMFSGKKYYSGHTYLFLCIKYDFDYINQKWWTKI